MSPAIKTASPGLRPKEVAAVPRLRSAGWTTSARAALETLIRQGAGRGLPVAFDFDNTIVCGDIGEATLAILTKSGRLREVQIPAALCPPFRLPDGRRIRLETAADLTAYYEAFLAPTAHGPGDPTPLANGYAWAVEVMSGLTVRDVICATAQASALAVTGEQRMIEVTPGHTAFPAPYFYPEVVELIAQLLRHAFDVWIVSASNVWSVRWMVQEKLNLLLRRHGVRRGLRPDRVLGLSTMLQDRQGRLYKDACLIRHDPRYARLEPTALRALRLTGLLQFPVPTYSGKVGCLWDVLGGPPWLAAGDSPGDHAMLSFSRHRLWIARLDKPSYQQATADLIRQTGRSGWIVQPVLNRSTPGFLADWHDLPGAEPAIDSARRASLRCWKRARGAS